MFTWVLIGKIPKSADAMIVLLNITLHTENLHISSFRIGTDSRYSLFEREKNADYMRGHEETFRKKNFITLHFD